MKDLTWEDIAELYNKNTGGRAFTQPMERVLEWAIKQKLIEETKNGFYKLSTTK